MTVTACPACNAAPAAIAMADRPAPVTLSVPGIRCAACIGTIERALTALPGVKDARVNLTLKRVGITTDRPTDEMIAALSQVGYDAFPLDAAALGPQEDPKARDLMLRVGVAGFAMMNVMLLSVAVWSGAADATRDLFHLISAGISLPAVFYSAQPFFQNALSALRVRRLNMDVPISLAIILAAIMSLYEALNGGAHAYFDAALSLTFFLLIGRVLEYRTRAAARSAAQELSALEVHSVQRKLGNTVTTIPASALAVGDTVVVPTGVRVPADGRLTSRAAFTDRAFLTGESEPVQHSRDATLQAGEINLGAPFEMVAEAVGQDTRLRRMAELVATAENARNRYTSLADRAAQIYAPAVHLLAAVTFAGWLIATGDLRHSLNIAIAVLIITCPCALGLAVPAVSTAAIGKLYRLGYLVKSGTALERLAEVDHVVFDKTGTLTRPGFDFQIGHLTPAQRGIAKALAQASSHPVSQALAQYLADEAGADVTAITEIPGRGMKGQWEGRTVHLEKGGEPGGEGGLVLDDGQCRIPLSYDEVTAPGADMLSPALQRRGLGVTVLSGDAPGKTERLAAHLGIADWHAGQSPEDKHRLIATRSAAGEKICMVGDGINDTAALTAAHASIAPGRALDAARNAADVVLLGETLADLPTVFGIARKAVRLSRQNFGIAFAYNLIAVPLAIAGFATPLMAALAMSFSSITVLLNAMRVRIAK